MKINVIPDLHGMDVWKELVYEQADLYIFLGDYCDSFTIKNEDIVNNLLDIIEFKKQNLDKVVLLYGNHEFHYLYLGDHLYSCSGIRPEIMHTLHDILRTNKDLFQNAFQYEKHIFTHAGIQDNWFRRKYKGNVNKNIAEQLNNPENREQQITLHDVGYMRWGSQDVGGIFWCDRSELKKPLKQFTQVVGHNPVKDLIDYRWHNARVLFCDYLQTVVKPLVLEINDKNS